ncbi:MAG: hypothetical protein AAFV53_11375 [Myxococcota bacterium]
MRADSLLTWTQARDGLAWSLSNMGALPPPQTATWIAIQQEDARRIQFDLNLDAVGFDPRAHDALRRAVQPLLDSDEMATVGTVDVGRFLMRTLYSPWQYYAITGACADRQEWTDRYLSETTDQYAVTLSLLSEKHRRITFNDRPWETIQEIAFLSESGSGDLQQGDFSPIDFEVIDIMSNGQQRFAVYDAQGSLISAIPDTHPAGQPGSCMWCHEGYIQYGTFENPSASGYIDYLLWEERVFEMVDRLTAHRDTLETAVVFDNLNHTYGELLTREFLYPTPGRLSAEWDADAAALIAAQGLHTTSDEEHPARGEIVTRTDADQVFIHQLPQWSETPGHRFEGLSSATYQPLSTLPDDRAVPSGPNASTGREAYWNGANCWRP